MIESIPLSEKLYLLGIHPKKGGIMMASRTGLHYAISGGLLLEMCIAGNICITDERIEVLKEKAENELHQFILDKLLKQNRNLKIRQWINKLHFSNRYIRRIIQQNLIGKRIILLKEHRFLFFRWKSPVLINKEVVYHLTDEIYNIVFKGSESEEGLILIFLLEPAGLLRRVFTSGDRRKEARRRIKSIITSKPKSINVSNAILVTNSVKQAVAVANTAYHGVV